MVGGHYTWSTTGAAFGLEDGELKDHARIGREERVHSSWSSRHGHNAETDITVQDEDYAQLSEMQLSWSRVDNMVFCVMEK